MTSTHSVRSAAMAACLLSAVACATTESPSTPPPAEPAAAKTPEAPPPVTATIQVDMETVPAEEDFEDEAEAAITPANLEKQLDAMEKEILAE